MPARLTKNGESDSRGAIVTVDIGYACFLVPAAAGLTGSFPDLIVITLWLVFASFLAAPLGTFFAIVHRRDRVLPVLAILTVLAFVELMTEAGSSEFYNAVPVAYTAVVLALEASWFLWRRRRVRVAG